MGLCCHKHQRRLPGSINFGMQKFSPLDDIMQAKILGGLAMADKQKKPIYKRWWFWVIVVIVIIAIGSQGGGDDTPEEVAGNDLSSQIEDNAENDVAVEEREAASVDLEEPEEESKEEPKEELEEELEEEVEESSGEAEEDIPKEYQSALRKAEIYANKMHMSKAAVYDQLVSEYGEKFSEEAAQYAIDNVEADWKENALQKAIIYQDEMAMSPKAIYDQLISEYGEKFTEEEAQYAIDNLPE